MKIDLVGPSRRGFAMGLNEAAGYGAVSLAALASGYLAATYALRPQPFYLGVAFAPAGLLPSGFFVRESHGHARHEAALLGRGAGEGDAAAAHQPPVTARRGRPAGHEGDAAPPAYQPPFAQVFLLTSWRERALFAA